jgi:hypothetical protein
MEDEGPGEGAPVGTVSMADHGDGGGPWSQRRRWSRNVEVKLRVARREGAPVWVSKQPVDQGGGGGGGRVNDVSTFRQTCL